MISSWRGAVVCGLVFVGGATADFERAHVYHSLLLSDVCFILAALIVAVDRSLVSPRELVSLLRRRRDLAALAGVAVLYLVGNGVSTLIIGVPRDALETWLLFAMLMLAIVPALAVITSGDRAYPLSLVAGIVTGALAGTYGFADRILLKGDPLSGSRVEGSLGGDPTFLMVVAAAIAATAVVIFISVPEARPRRWKLFVGIAIGVLAILAAGLVFSRSRSAWLAFIALAPTVLVVVRGSIKGAAIAGIAVVGATAIAYLASLLPQGIEDRIEMTFDPGDAGNTQRLDAIGELMPVWAHHPWGIGIGASPDYVSPELFAGNNRYIHNVVLNALVEGGVLAGIAMAALPVVLIWIWRTALRRRPAIRADWLMVWPITAAIPLYISALFTPSLYPHAFWIVVGALAGASLLSAPRGADPARPAASEGIATGSAERSRA